MVYSPLKVLRCHWALKMIHREFGSFKRTLIFVIFWLRHAWNSMVINMYSYEHLLEGNQNFLIMFTDLLLVTSWFINMFTGVEFKKVFFLYNYITILIISMYGQKNSLNVNIYSNKCFLKLIVKFELLLSAKKMPVHIQNY